MAGPMMSEMNAWLDVTLLRCPKCGHYYVDASWYVVKNGKMRKVEISEHLKLE